jgi:hypothetical protein
MLHLMAGVSSETVALIAAAGTAAGALIGSTSGGVIQFRLDRAREKRRAFAGARLVRLEISLTASALRDAEHDAKWWVFWDDDPLPAWEAYAEALSVRLTPDEFEAVTQSVWEMSRFSEEIRKAPMDDPNGGYWTLSPKAVGKLKDMRANATAAFNALAKIAKDPDVVEAGKLLHEDQAPT